MDSITIFGITIKNISRVAFTIPIFGGWDVYWYGILLTAGVFAGLLYAMKNAERYGMNPDHFFNSFIVVLPVSILAARAYYIIFDPAGSSFKDFFDFENHGFTGLAVYGSIIGALAAAFVMQRIYKFNILATLDLIATGFILGQGIGRWGNFVNQEAYGVATGSDWFGMTGNLIAGDMGTGVLVHPCFLYESIWCIAGFFLLHYFSKRRVFKGQIALMYGVWYGFERTFIEMLRTDSLMLGSIRVSSLLSALLCIACAITLYVLLARHKEKSGETGYVPQFAEADEMTVTALPEEPDAAENPEEAPVSDTAEEAMETTEAPPAPEDCPVTDDAQTSSEGENSHDHH